MKNQQRLSSEGLAFLADPTLASSLWRICRPLGVTPEEYLLRFEEVLRSDPEAIFAIFDP